MLNYIKAELYKVRRRPAVWAGLPVLLLLEGIFLVLVRLSASQEMTFGDMAYLLESMLLFGFVLLLSPANVVFSEQYKHRTLRNEVEFGLPRRRIYLGKLVTSLLLACLTCLALLAVWLGGSMLLTGDLSGMDMLPRLTELGHNLLLFLPLWLGALGLYHALQFAVHSSAGAIMLYLGYFLIIEPFGIFLEEVGAGPLSLLVRQVSFSMALTGENAGILRAWLVGLGWLVGSTAAGLALFHRRDIP